MKTVSLDGVRMRAMVTADSGEVSAATVFTFSQTGTTVWARYEGGAIEVGYLVGTFAAGRLMFRYAQINRLGNVDGGRSECEVQTLPDGRARIVEHFQWESRQGSGTNVFEQTSD